MKPQALLQLGAEQLHLFRHSNTPADRALAEYFRSRKFLGAGDRAFIADNYYHLLRHLRRIDEAILSAFTGQSIVETQYSTGFPVTADVGARAWQRTPGKGAPPRHTDLDRATDTLRLGLAAIERKEITAADVAAELTRSFPTAEGRQPLSATALQRMTERAAEVMELYRHPRRALDTDRAWSFPPWLWAMLAYNRADEELRRLGDALNEQAPMTLRVNTLRANVDEAARNLDRWKVVHKPCTYAPHGLLLEKRASRGAIPRMDDGWFEVQDEGSQLVSVYTAPTPGSTVVDACAGGGGKSIHLAAMMENKGRILAADAEPARLENLKKRAERSGATIIELIDAAQTPEADLVLIDAPCSGTGTLRRNPEIRWRLTQRALQEVIETQMQLLDKWAPSVKTGGHLVYATCSLLREENEAQIDRFLEVNKDFELDPPQMDSMLLTDRGELRLLPHVHGCDGFYAARLRRK